MAGFTVTCRPIAMCTALSIPLYKLKHNSTVPLYNNSSRLSVSYHSNLKLRVFQWQDCSISFVFISEKFLSAEAVLTGIDRQMFARVLMLGNMVLSIS